MREMSIDLLIASLKFRKFYYSLQSMGMNMKCNIDCGDSNDTDQDDNYSVIISIIQHYQYNEAILSNALPLLRNWNEFIDICYMLLLDDDRPESVRLIIAQTFANIQHFHSFPSSLSFDFNFEINNSKEWQIYYKLLTDDCREIRLIISPFICNSLLFREGEKRISLSVSEILKFLLTHQYAIKANVMEMKEIEELGKKIESLFIHEPLNMFRDKNWELLYLKKYHKSKSQIDEL